MTAMPTCHSLDTRSELAQSRQVVGLLRKQSAYREQTATVEQIETHISWVFLTDHFAYKLKKPVRFDFLDFSTVELRRRACENEVKLNRRFARGVYLGVIPIVITASGQLRLEQPGIPVDWVVKMRRLPAGNALDVLISEGRVPATAIERLAKTLSDFYNNVPPVTMTVEDYRRSIERRAIANRDELAARTHHLDESTIRRVHSAQLRVLRIAPEMLDERVRNGRILEGHGDLRPEHIYFNPSPLIIDCIEFKREFRTLDVVDELAFLAMECDFLEADGITKPIFDRYFAQSGDSPPQQLIDFYRIYRACVRAKVSALRAEQLAGDAREQLLASSRKYLDLADRYARELGPPLLVLVRGLPGTGKSTIAQAISEQLEFALVQTDAVRRSLLGSSDDVNGFNEGDYRPKNRASVYEAMHNQAERLLSNGTSVVLDGTYLTASLRNDAAKLAERQRAQLLVVHCQCPDHVAVRRLGARALAGTSLSETRPEFFDQQRQAEEPDLSDQSSLAVDTSSGIGEPMRCVFEALYTRCFGDMRTTPVGGLQTASAR